MSLGSWQRDVKGEALAEGEEDWKDHNGKCVWMRNNVA